MNATKPFVVRGHEGHDAAVPDPASDTIARINSVVPMIARMINRSRAGLDPKRRAFLGADDLLQEVWAELLVKDRYFDPGRAKYLTFATMLTQRLLCDLIDRHPESRRCGPIAHV